MKKPHIIDFNKIGNTEVGFISVAENYKDCPFEIKRVYWVYETPSQIERGNHAHKKGEQVLIALNGSVDIHLKDTFGKEYSFHLNDRSKGLFVPAMYWRRLNLDNNCLILSLSSSLYEEDDYIRDYDEFIAFSIQYNSKDK